MNTKIKKQKIRLSFGDQIFDICNTMIMIFLVVITLYPFLYVIFASFSNPADFSRVRGLLWKPAGFSIRGYQAVFAMKNIWIGYRNTIFYVVFGGAVSMFLTILGAYALSVKGYILKKPIMLMIVFTMYFNGGMVPTFLLVKKLGLVDTVWSVIFPGCVSVYNLIVLRTAFQSIPESLLESAELDGANYFVQLTKIVLPVSKAALATITLFYAVSRWGEWYSAMVYLSKRRDLYPLQMFLREMLIKEKNIDNFVDAFSAESADFYLLKEITKYATVVVSTVPILFVYPFLQRYFVKGVMLGSIKE